MDMTIVTIDVAGQPEPEKYEIDLSWNPLAQVDTTLDSFFTAVSNDTHTNGFFLRFTLDDLPSELEATSIVDVDLSDFHDNAATLGMDLNFVAHASDDTSKPWYHFESGSGISAEEVDLWVHYTGLANADRFVRKVMNASDIRLTYLNADGELNEALLCAEGRRAAFASPIALDLNGDGEIGVTGQHTARDSVRTEIGDTVEFDIDADGELDTIEWFAGDGDGILVNQTDIGPNNEIDGSALFGDQGGLYDNGYDKLALLDANGDGSVSDAELADLAVWIDDGDAKLEDGELKSLSDFDIASVSVQMELDSEGRMRSSAQRADGSSIMTEDVWFAVDDIDGPQPSGFVF